jgi:hypothetical protein
MSNCYLHIDWGAGPVRRAIARDTHHAMRFVSIGIAFALLRARARGTPTGAARPTLEMTREASRAARAA